jgi:hypothetical protein
MVNLVDYGGLGVVDVNKLRYLARGIQQGQQGKLFHGHSRAKDIKMQPI